MWLKIRNKNNSKLVSKTKAYQIHIIETKELLKMKRNFANSFFRERHYNMLSETGNVYTCTLKLVKISNEPNILKL